MDLATHYLGLALKNPLIASASPLTGELGTLRQIEDAGAAAVVLPSIFEEQVEAEAAELEQLASVGEGFPEAASYFPARVVTPGGPERQIELIRRARAALDIPVIASLNGTTSAGWTDYARLAEEAGASAIELNVFFVPTDPRLDGQAVERRYLEVLRAVKRAVTIPVTMKLSPYFTATAQVVRALDAAGADGFALFNRFYEPDIDLATLGLRRDLDLSTPAEIRLGLLWIGVLAGSLRGSLAATTGVETEAEVIKYLLVGADAVMTTSALLRHGPEHLHSLRDGLARWGEARGLAAVADIRGRMSRQRVGATEAYDRANYMRILQGFTPER